jgi:hypothetical protein
MTTATTGTKQAPDEKQNSRIYFDREHEESVKDDAYELANAVFYSCAGLDPAPIVRIFATLEKQCKDPHIQNALLFLSEASFNHALSHTQALYQYMDACLALPIRKELDDDEPVFHLISQGRRPAPSPAPEKPDSQTPFDTDLTFNLCDCKEKLLLDFFNQDGDQIFNFRINREGADELDGIYAYIEAVGSELFELAIKNIRAPERKDAIDHEEKITLAGRSIVRFVGRKDKLLFSLLWNQTGKDLAASVQVYGAGGKVIRSLKVYE